MHPCLKIAACQFALAAYGHAGKVSLSQDAKVFRMSNGELAVAISKASATVVSATLGGQELLGGGTGYWSMSAASGRTRVGGFGVSRDQAVVIDPATNDGARAAVVCRMRGTGADGAYPGRVEVHYSLGRDAGVLHVGAVMDHGPGDAPFRLGEGRFVIKLHPQIFNHLSIDHDRYRDMPTGADWDRGKTLNLSEVRRLTTGTQAGRVEHKYGYSALLAGLPAYGWRGTRQPYGVWLINPSGEYLAGGPVKMELTGHLDVGTGGRPTLLNMWHGSHYGGTVLNLGPDEVWSKVIGPFAVHFNRGGQPSGLWARAIRQAAQERQSWPYPWFRHEAYPPAAARGGLAGRIRVNGIERQPPRGIRIGLTAPDHDLPLPRGAEIGGWQRDGRSYQYWTRTAADGSFQLPHVRPGTYVLRAFADGVWGEFARAGITVRAGGVTELGTVAWTPAGAGPTLWQIGIPDRSAAEFRNGDRYWEWGNYLRFRQDFPNGVNYTVGRSDWTRDWHLCQPLDLSPECRVLGGSVWTVRFPLERVPPAGVVLRVAFCGSRDRVRWSVDLNGRQLAPAESMPENGVMHRDSHRGIWFERSFTVPAAGLKAGSNTLGFRLSGSAWHQGVLYDCIRMEQVEGPAAATIP
jgi:rhamnogalacturonan endolyase